VTDTFKLKTNVPVVGKLLGVDYAKSKNPDYADQSKLYGEWDDVGKGRFYLHLSLIDQLLEAHVIKTSGTDEDGNPAYTMLQKPRVRILREETKGNAKRTTITVLDDEDDEKEPDEAPPAKGASSPHPAPEHPAPPPEDTEARKAVRKAGLDAARKKGLSGWRVLSTTYQRAISEARAAGFKTEEGLSSAAATLLIQAAREGWWLLPDEEAKAIAPDPEASATAFAVTALRQYLQHPDVPERTFQTYTRMLDGMGANVTVGDVAKIRAAVEKAVKAAS
jgi:hypothetical protein